MSEVGIRALKQNASAVVAQAAAGERITITDHGRPVAQIAPLPTSELQSMLDAGQARAARRDIALLGPPLVGDARSAPLSAELTSMRDAERT
jgi:prevent-host-death family protein